MPDYDVLYLKNGGRREFWLSHAAIVGRFVDAHLKELTKVQVAGQAPAMVEHAVGVHAAARPLIWDPTRGGMRMPHLHYAGEVFIMNEAQWAEFSKSAVAALVDKMKGAQRVGFEDMLQLSEAVAGT
jgi:hypothetical protein